MKKTASDLSMELSSYGPGKYTHNVDAFVHDQFTDAEIGDVQTTGWYGLYTGGLLGDIVADETLTESDIAFLRTQQAAIAFEDDQGFVDVTYYADDFDALAAWSQLEDEIAALYDDGD